METTVCRTPITNGQPAAVCTSPRFSETLPVSSWSSPVVPAHRAGQHPASGGGDVAGGLPVRTRHPVDQLTLVLLGGGEVRRVLLLGREIGRVEVTQQEREIAPR